ncbi:hypothetical protein [Mesorhizobium sp. ISC15]|uniref:hypothetical protein n=1 Tax=Mesorhizobium sp. ISC15 TaxID=3076429 RepID=UPI00301BFAFD
MQTAVALAILAIEEVGKFLLEHPALQQEINPPKLVKKKTSFPHKQKQRSAAEAVLWLFPFDEIFDVLRGCGFTVSLVPIGEGNGVSMIEAMEESYARKPVLISTKHRLSRVDALIWLLRGDLDIVKQKCLYNDNNDETDEYISGRFCEGTITLAQAAISGAIVRVRMFEKQEANRLVESREQS